MARVIINSHAQNCAIGGGVGREAPREPNEDRKLAKMPNLRGRIVWDDEGLTWTLRSKHSRSCNRWCRKWVGTAVCGERSSGKQSGRKKNIHRWSIQTWHWLAVIVVLILSFLQRKVWTVSNIVRQQVTPWLINLGGGSTGGHQGCLQTFRAARRGDTWPCWHHRWRLNFGF